MWQRRLLTSFMVAKKQRERKEGVEVPISPSRAHPQ
jgi:hypothetical protein